MSIAYRPKVNKRPATPISSEQHVIGISGVFTSTPDRIRLIEVPLKELISSVFIPGYSEVDINGPAPTGFQFAVDYSVGHIFFDPARNGNTIFVSYKGLGSEVDSEDVNELQIPVGVALNANGSLVNEIVHPNNISTALSFPLDDFIFPRDVTATRNLIIDGSILTINAGEIGSPTLNALFTAARGSSPTTSLRWNESVDAWEFVSSTGTANLQIFDDSHIVFNGQLQVGTGTALLPSYSFALDPDTGIYNSGTDRLGFSTNGSLKWEVTSSGIWFADTAFPNTVVQANDGVLALPAYGFATQGGLGMYRIGSNHLGFITNSLLQLDITTSLISTQIPINVLGSVGGTSATFSDNTNSALRIEHPALNVLALDINSSNFFKFTVASTEIARLKSGQAQFGDGSFSLPGISFLTDTSLGISKPFSNTLGFSIAGFEVARFTPNGDFQILEGEKVIFDGIGDVFLSYTPSNSFYGQTDNLGTFKLGSAQDTILFSHAIVGSGEPNISMPQDGSVHIYNSNQGLAADRSFYLNISQGFSNGFHRLLKFFPTGTALIDFPLGLGYQADGTDIIASTIDTKNSLPLKVTIDDVVKMTVSSTTVDVASSKITSVADPTVATDAANKRYVDGISAGLDPKQSVRAATTANIVLSGLLTVDGTTVIDGDRVLVKNQTSAINNGIYNAHSGAWTRATDFDGTPSNEVSGGNYTFVETGTLNVSTGWVVVWDGNIVVGTDTINWTQFSNTNVAASFTTVSSDPGSPFTGQVWFNTTDFQFKGYNGTSIVILG
jgi:hypothetical protein